METVFSVGSTPKLYKEDPRPAEIELRDCLETAVEWLRRDGKKGMRLHKEDFICATVTVRQV
jgi:hypothetical protein